MEEKILSLLNKLLEGQKDTTQKLDRIEKKLDAVVDQTADLTEFRTEMNAFRIETNEKLDDLKSDLTNVEVITASNWKDIAKLKAVK